MEQQVKSYLALVEKEIARHKYGRQPDSLYEPIRYLMSLGGKRLRPMLTLLSYSLYKSDVKSILPYAAAVEVFHNFTLMHDDIMDKAPLRRGQATVHEKWNVNTAILVRGCDGIRLTRRTDAGRSTVRSNDPISAASASMSVGLDAGSGR